MFTNAVGKNIVVVLLCSALSVRQTNPNAPPPYSLDTSCVYAPPSRISSSCVPRSTTRPPSSTTISSQSRMVESLCATTMQVMPRFFMELTTSYSVLASSALVASSSIDYRGILRQHARYLHALPLAARKVLAALGQLILIAALALHDILVQLRVARRHDHLKVLYGGIPHFYIVGDGILEKDYVLIHYGQRAGEHAAVYFVYAACRRKVSRRSRAYKGPEISLDSVDLPQPEAPTNATRLPVLSVRLKSGYQRLRQTRVAERHVFHLYAAGKLVVLGVFIDRRRHFVRRTGYFITSSTRSISVRIS